jgi:4-hydroxy-tetrahydrodipicolinate synthase
MTEKALAAGVYPVMLTPFTRGNAVDYEALDALTDWYIDAGVGGLFAVAQSSEMFALTDEERLAVAERVVDRADGRVPVVATGTFGGPIPDQAESVERMAETGVDAVVVNAAQLADEDDDEAVWEEHLFDLLDRTSADLGFYECPQPYHRTISPAALGRAADTGRFLFIKETTSDPPVTAEKIAAAEGTPLGVYAVNAQVLRQALRDGARGYASIAANVYPELLAWLCEHYDDPRADAVDDFLTVADHAVRNEYLTSAKAFLARSGLDIETVCRTEVRTLEAPDEHTLAALRRSVERRRRDLGIADPFAGDE